MLRKSYWLKSTLVAAFAAVAWGGSFGTVVSIGGQASGLALDEQRGVLYVANFTANRIEVMSLSNNAIQTSINVAAQPSSLALSPDDRYLVVTHFGNAVPPASSSNAVTASANPASGPLPRTPPSRPSPPATGCSSPAGCSGRLLASNRSAP